MDYTKNEKEDVSRRVKKYAADRKKVERDEKKVRREFGKKLEKTKGADKGSSAVRKLLANVKCLYEMLIDSEYRISWQTKAWIVFALVYFISPLDAIPDAIPVLGLLDDALLVAFVVHQLQGDIVEYRKFRRESGRPLLAS